MTLRANLQHFAVRAFGAVGLKGVLLAVPGGYLRQTGWMRSARARRPLDRSGLSQPWLTMPAVAFLDERLRADLTLFEYGSGGSTAWYARRVKQITAVEHDRHWYDIVRGDLPANASVRYFGAEPVGDFLKLVFRPLGAPLEYANSILAVVEGDYPDVVIVDGIDRLNCIAVVADTAPNSTVIVVDNLEYTVELAPAIDLLRERGFRYLGFCGLAPGELRLSNTGIFYRTGNCLGI